MVDCSTETKKERDGQPKAIPDKNREDFKPLKINKFVAVGVDGSNETSPANGPQSKIREFVGTGVDGN